MGRDRPRSGPRRAASAGRRRSRRQARSPRPIDDVLEHEAPPHEARRRRPQGGAEGEHRRQREAVVEPRLEVQRVADRPRNPRVGDHARGQHGIGGGEQRAEQERLGPAQTGQQLGAPRRRSPRSAAWPARACGTAAASGDWSISAVDLEAVAEQDHDQRHGGQLGHEPASGHRSAATPVHALAEHEAGEHEQRRQRQEAPPRRARRRSAPTTSRPPSTSSGHLEVAGRPAAGSTGRCRCAAITPIKCQSLDERGAVCG